MGSLHDDELIGRIRGTIAARSLADPDAAVLLMVSGGSDSTALAYAASELFPTGEAGALAMLHVNHRLRGRAADEDALFVQKMADALAIPLFSVEVDVAGEAHRSGENVEAVARRERYLAADEALESLCFHCGRPLGSARIFTAHTQDDRVESFYMRSIVGTGPGGFRAMRYRNGPVGRPCMDVSRQDLRDYLERRAAADEPGHPVVRDGKGKLWREDATNAHTDRFRAYVRHEIVPRAKERNPQLLDTLCRSMDLIADEDDMLDEKAAALVGKHVLWNELDEVGDVLADAGCVLDARFGAVARPMQRRAVMKVLQRMLGADSRVEAASVDAVLAGFRDAHPISGYTGNIQGNLALSANKDGVRIEPMAAYRARRKPDRL